MGYTNEGYIFLSRSIIKSPIFKKPPLYTKVWVYMLCRAQHRNYKDLKRGQLITSIPEIQKACTYYVGARKEIPTKRQIFTILEWLRCPKDDFTKVMTGVTLEVISNEPMIVTTKVTHGILVTILNYDFFQDPGNYESNSEGNAKQGKRKLYRKNLNCYNINKNVFNKNEDIFGAIISYLNEKTDKQFKATTKVTIGLIDARFKEGFTVDHFKAVIDKKTQQWKDNAEMSGYLRPETLFSAKHFESYLNEAPALRSSPRLVQTSETAFKLT